MQLTFPNIDQYIKINQFAQDIRDAIAFYKLNSETQSNSNAFAKFDNVLNELQKMKICLAHLLTIAPYFITTKSMR
ncbi:hypothetical protein OK024_17020 [Acinetobacter sp. UGAL515B_02]|nr:hypothetical protein [Acinetobacter sp. UGAL515B_02]WON80344.1 hypothetical protein OK024_17020 [Acinetobacter sp. UGAL515B_02]